MKFREANGADRKSGGSPIKGLSFLYPASTALPENCVSSLSRTT
jgi:hypothetical protein